jgi:ABC-type molybdenum transport system ATPase subunit/photorepair protein PhrA/GNAT superfamily N-acetyltransferase
VTVSRSTPIERTPRLLQLEGLFDVPPAERVDLTWDVALPLAEREWNIGLIVGPSGCGKTSIAREYFGPAYMTGFSWPGNKSIVDAFPSTMGIKDITLLLSSVGFSSPPSWVRPFHVLSNGEQFRATLARALAERPELCVFDEFTSVVDRTVGKIGSAAVAKTVRRRGSKFVAVTCHDDVLEWLDPDWVFTPATNSFAWRSLHGRPKIKLEICRVHNSAWALFAQHHYLTASLAKSAFCFCAFINGRPVAFDAWLPFFGKANGLLRRGHRTVCLPDYQGVGIGNALFTRIASMWRAFGYRAVSCTGHPAEIAHRVRSPLWRMTSRPTQHAAGRHTVDRTRALDRLVASFEYVGPKMSREDAERQLNAWAIRC